MAPTDKDRVVQFREHVSALNKQFLEWTGRQWTKSPTRFWSSGLQDYLRNVAKIRREFADVLTDDGEQPAQSSLGVCGWRVGDPANQGAAAGWWAIAAAVAGRQRQGGKQVLPRLALSLLPGTQLVPMPPPPSLLPTKLADNNSSRSRGNLTPEKGPPGAPAAGAAATPASAERAEKPVKYEPQLSLTPYCNTKVIHFIRHGCAWVGPAWLRIV